VTKDDIQVGDVVRLEGETKPRRVDAITPQGMLTLETLHAMTRIVLWDVHVSRVTRAGMLR